MKIFYNLGTSKHNSYFNDKCLNNVPIPTLTKSQTRGDLGTILSCINKAICSSNPITFRMPKLVEFFAILSAIGLFEKSEFQKSSTFSPRIQHDFIMTS